MASPAKAAANCDPRPHEQLDHEAPAHICAYAVCTCTCAVMVVPIRDHHLVILRLHRESKEEA